MCKLTAHEVFVCSTEGKKQKNNETNQSTHDDCFTRVLPNKIGYISSTLICRAPALGCLTAVKKTK